MKTVSLYPFCVETPGNGEQFGHPWHGLVESRVETSYLRKFRMTLTENLD